MTQYTTTAAVAVGTSNPALGGVKLAQSFSLVSPISLTGVDLGLKRVGTPTNSTLTLSVVLSSAESSSGNPVATPVTNGTGTFAINTDTNAGTATVKTTPDLYSIDLAGTVALNANTTYWLVLETDYDSTSDYIEWLAFDASTFSGFSRYYRTMTVTGWLPLSVAAKDFTFRLRCATASPSPSPSAKAFE